MRRHDAPRYNRAVSKNPRILIVKLSSFGDILHALSLVDALRTGLPDATIDWVVRADLAALVEGHPGLNRVHKLGRKSFAEGLRMGRELRGQRYDIAFDIQGLFYSGWITWLSGAQRRIGFDNNREGNRFLLTDSTTPGTDQAPMAEKILRVADRIGLPRATVVPQTWLAKSGAADAESLLARVPTSSIPVGLVVGASTPVKTLSPERWISLAARLSTAGLHPVLIGAKAEIPVADQVASEVSCTNLVAKTPFSTLPAILARCAVVVGGDTGATHLAAALGVPVVGLYGATDPKRSGADWGPGPSVILDGGDHSGVRNFRHAPAGIIDRIAEVSIVDAVLGLSAEANSMPSPHQPQPVE